MQTPLLVMVVWYCLGVVKNHTDNNLGVLDNYYVFSMAYFVVCVVPNSYLWKWSRFKLLAEHWKLHAVLRETTNTINSPYL